MARNCSRCGKTICASNQSGYCQQCLVIVRREEKVKNWLESGDTGFTVDTTIRGAIRDYILNDQNCKCAICGLVNEWNGETLNFVLDHIDGNASNSARENLRLVCPNCDSQLPTFKSRNKNSVRNKRKEFLNETVPRNKDKE